MQMLIDIDESLLERAMELSGTSNPSTVINTALLELVRRYETLNYSVHSTN